MGEPGEGEFLGLLGITLTALLRVVEKRVDGGGAGGLGGRIVGRNSEAYCAEMAGLADYASLIRPSR